MSRCDSLALVSCVGKKVTQPSVAKDLYQSDWFFKARRYVEQQDWDWCILSAKYGLLHRDTVVEPYEQTLKALRANQRRQWSEEVLKQVFQDYPDVKLIRLFAGQYYRQYLIPKLEVVGYTVEVPLKGLGIGQQLSWFKLHTLSSST